MDMKKLILMTMALTAASFMLISCGAPAANNAGNAGNKAANTATAPAADKAAVEAELKKMIDDFAAALNKGDVAALDKMYSDDYVLIDQNGTMQTKASRIESIKTGKVKMEGLKFEDLKIKTNPAGDGAVITAHVSGKNIIDGKSEDRNSMVTWVLGKMKDKGWQFVNAQVTDIKAGAPKAEDDKKADDAKKDTDDKKEGGEKKEAPPANK
jgi:ketosteroid isomerase-like protein